MKVLFLVAAALQLSAGALASNFFIYKGTAMKDSGGVDDSYVAWAFFPTHPNKCDYLNPDWITFYETKDDASHDRLDVVCEGNGCPWEKGDPDLITRLEFSTGFGHFTYYKGPAAELVGLDGNVYGHCYAMPLNTNFTARCNIYHSDMIFVDATAYFWCKLDTVEMTDNPGQ